MLEDSDAIYGCGVRLAREYRRKGFAPMVIITFYDDKDCNAVACCEFRDKHYHIPYSCPAGQRPSRIAKVFRDVDVEEIDDFIDGMLTKLLDASETEKLFMEVREDAAIN